MLRSGLSGFAGLCLLAAFAFYVASNALPSWGKGENDTTIGLWKVCGRIQGINACGDLKCTNQPGADLSPCVKMEVARAFMTIACIISFIAAIILFLRVVPQLGPNQVIAYTSKALPIISLAAGAIGFGVGLSFILDYLSLKFSIGAILAAVALGLNLIGIIAAVISPIKN